MAVGIGVAAVIGDAGAIAQPVDLAMVGRTLWLRSLSSQSQSALPMLPPCKAKRWVGWQPWSNCAGLLMTSVRFMRAP